MVARTLMVQGTASSVGKSLLVTGLCRMFQREGVRVAPFKSQNMALNSYVTPDGHEIGRAQAVQAEAARVVPTVDMNPILLKPEGDSRSQVVVLGKSIGSMLARDYHAHKPDLRRIVAESLARLREAYDLIVIEGAGSPAEINLKDRDIVNMHVARIADAPVLLVGDIDRGGVFAAFVGTMELLEPDERARIAAFVVNKFRGDIALLEPGLDFLRKRTGVPVLGVVPYVARLRVADEDSVALDDRQRRPRASAEQIEIAVIRLPRISNYDDFAPLEHERDVVVRFVDEPSAMASADLVIVPGTKSTIADLAWLRAGGLAEALVRRAHEGHPVVGICGGCQMLGGSIEDPFGAESPEVSSVGLELLRIRTRFERSKTTAQVKARGRGASILTSGPGDGDLDGYEIHMGTVQALEPGCAAFEIHARNNRAEHALDGAVAAGGAVVGTMIHGLFDNDRLRSRLVAALREKKGLPELCPSPALWSKDAEYDRVADAVRASIDRSLLERIMRGERLHEGASHGTKAPLWSWAPSTTSSSRSASSRQPSAPSAHLSSSRGPSTRIALVLGGARSGKSRHAAQMALRRTPSPVLLAPSRAWDADHAARIARHKADRGPEWTTIEEEKAIARTDLGGRVVVVDCVTLWLTNFFADAQWKAAAAHDAARAELTRAFAIDATWIFVSNELGMAPHAASEAARKFVDVQGFINQEIAARADAVVLMVAGIPLAVKGSAQ